MAVAIEMFNRVAAEPRGAARGDDAIIDVHQLLLTMMIHDAWWLTIDGEW